MAFRLLIPIARALWECFARVMMICFVMRKRASPCIMFAPCLHSGTRYGLMYCYTSGPGEALSEEDSEGVLPHEPSGHGEIATGSVTSCAAFWRTFVRSTVVLDWIENGYQLLWSQRAPERREMDNAPSAKEHHEFVSAAVAEMLLAGAITRLPPGEKPWVVSPLGVVPKPRTDKFRLTVNMRYVNRHLGRKAFKFEGLKDLSDLAEKEDHAVSYDLTSGYYHVGLHPCSRRGGAASRCCRTWTTSCS